MMHDQDDVGLCQQRVEWSMMHDEDDFGFCQQRVEWSSCGSRDPDQRPHRPHRLCIHVSITAMDDVCAAAHTELANHVSSLQAVLSFTYV